MQDRARDVGCPPGNSHLEGWARFGTTLKRALHVPQHSAVSGPRFSVGTTTGAIFFLFAVPLFRLSAQSDLDRLTLRITSMTAVTGL